MKPTLFTTLLTLAMAGGLHAQAPARLELKPGDHISILGNTLADRMQHFGWLETLIYSRFKEDNLVMRNLSFGGDEVNTWHRVDNFGTRDEWLGKTGTDVILAFYGFNESFKGYEGIDAFKKNLEKFLKDAKAQNYSGKGSPRIVLVSPIAAEKQTDPNIPDPGENNTNIQNYTAAMSEVAAAEGVQFVDLYKISQKLFAESKTPLTFNGIHLKDESYKALAPAFFEALFGEKAPSLDGLEKLRAAVVDRNEAWHNRYRTVDGYNVYGGRSALAYQPGKGGFVNDRNAPAPYLSNYKVMQEEMSVRDVLTANRDKVIWSVAKGKDAKPDDSNLPTVTPVETNKPGDLPDGKHTFLSGEESISKMKTPPGIKVQLFADEKMFPELIKPVQMAFDTKGRLWVAVWPNYPERTPTSTKGDSLLVFEDTNNDGKADKCTPFLDNLNCPTGFQFYKDGVLVMKSPDLLFVRDTDGDGRGDKVERVLTGLCASDSHHETNSMCYEPGGAVYCSDGVFHRTQLETAAGPVRNTDGAIYRYEPQTGKFERYAAYGFANPHGRVFDYWGNDLITDATGNANYYGPGFSGFLSEGKHSNYQQFWNRPSRPCAGTTILSSRHFPEGFKDNFLNLNVISIHGIFRVKMTEEGSGLKGENIEYDWNGEKLTTLVESSPKDNEKFRPSAAAVAPDGSLFFSDWSNSIIGHMQHHLRDPNRDNIHGRIYRVTYEGRPLLEPKKIDGEPVEKLLDLLKEPENDVRTRTKIELHKHATAEVIAATQKWVKQFDPNKVEDAHHILEALWVHQWHNVVNPELIATVLKSPEPRARAQAVRVVCYQRDRLPKALELLKAAANDPSPRVRLEAVRAASFFNGADVPKALDVAYDVLKYDTDYYLDYCLKETLRQLQSLSKEKVLPAEPAVLAALITRMDDKELDAQPAVEAVLVAKLQRKSYDLAKRDRFLKELARIRNTDPVAELVNAIKTLDGKDGADASVATELGKMLVATPAARLEKVIPQVTELAKGARMPAVSRTAWATLIMKDRKADDVWVASTDAKSRLAVVSGLALVTDPAVRAAFYPQLTSLLADAKTEGAVRKAAILALPLTGTQNAEAGFKVLANELKEGRERAAVASAMAQLPRTSWDKAAAGELAQGVLNYAKSVDAKRRAEQDFVELNQLGMELASLAGNAGLRKELRSLGVSVFVIKTVHEQLRFDTQRIVVEKGKPFEILFENTDVMPHNLVVVEPDQHLNIGMAAMTMSPNDKDKKGRAYLPKDFKVLDATHMLEPGQKEKLQLKAPDKEGNYEFVCTFPGHAMIMWGQVVVTGDVEGYLQANPMPHLPMATMPAAPPVK
ncbi:PVC-type heme-binding CxxCH protein [Verrucomicrobium sp. BvORR106]|uniref:PVC-type heme-binding CxxCH protein n=1 Tax=Verrucomicrobium sp. BvORR106 TaxID=1403819 RepID=UPI00057207B6|nr:PVC-type heme-binding CxxCH protein [Verrucomicrobium sp. BvORR106]